MAVVTGIMLCAVHICVLLYQYYSYIVQLNAISCTEKYDAGTISCCPFLFANSESSFMYNFWAHQSSHTWLKVTLCVGVCMCFELLGKAFKIVCKMVIHLLVNVTSSFSFKMAISLVNVVGL
jgi:hypothetical protein